MAKSKALIVSGTPPPLSGPEVMTGHLLRSSLKDRYQLIHFNISKGRDVGTRAKFDWVNLVYGVLQPFQLLWLMVRRRPDIVYTNMAQTLGGFLRYAAFIWVAALFRTPVVVRVMGDGFNHFYGRSGPAMRWLIRETLARVGRVKVRSAGLTRQFAGLVLPEKVRVVYSGIDAAEFDRPRTRAHEGEIHVLFVGYLTKAKGALDLLQAVPHVVARCPRVKIQLMGSKIDVERNITYIANPQSNEAVLQQLLSKPEIAQHVELLGELAGVQKVQVFVNADIFVLPSYSEAFPTVVIEAMAAGLPVVATPVGALPEAFNEQNILFVEAGDIEQLAAAICRLVESPELRQEMGSYNREIVRQNFHLDAYGARVGAVFAELLPPSTNQN